MGFCRYPRVILFKFQNIRNSTLRELREEYKHSTRQDTTRFLPENRQLFWGLYKTMFFRVTLTVNKLDCWSLQRDSWGGTMFRFLLTSNGILRHALGKDCVHEFRPSLHKLCKYVAGDVGLMCTSLSMAEVSYIIIIKNCSFIVGHLCSF